MNRRHRKTSARTVAPAPQTAGLIPVPLDPVAAENLLGFPDAGRLVEILRYKRRHKTPSEIDFVESMILEQYPQAKLAGPMDNVIITVGEGSKTLFSCHTDTVHAGTGHQVIYLHPVERSLHSDGTDVLGADDGASVWLMLNMIDAGVPGTYIFHRGEEMGCYGSSWMAERRQDWLRQFDRAIAFDRRGASEVITYQMGQRCCSDEFAEALAAELPSGYVASPNGVYTDTAQYTYLIPECTNVACGYYGEHRASESLHLQELQNLLERLRGVDWEALPTEREVAVGVEATLSEARDLTDLTDLGYEQLLEAVSNYPDIITDLLFFDLQERAYRREMFGSVMDVAKEI